MNNYTELDIARQEHKMKIQWAELARDGIIDRLAVWGPMLIPLIPAGLTLTAIGTRYGSLLHFPAFASWPIGVLAGAGVEVFGIVANENYLDMQRYNQTLAEGEEPAPQEEAKSARNTYMGIVIGLMLTLEVFPALVASLELPTVISMVSVLISIFPLVFLAVLSGQVIVMRKQHAARLDVRRQRELEADEERRRADQIVQLSGQLDTLTVQFGSLQTEHKTAQSKAAEAEKVTTQLTTKVDQLTSELTSKTDQLHETAERLRTLQSEHQSDQETIIDQEETIAELTSKVNSQIGKLVTLAVQPTAQPTGQLVYSNGDIAHGIEHLDTTDQIREIAQRMIDSGQRLNKSKIAELVNCSRTTVQSALKDWTVDHD